MYPGSSQEDTYLYKKLFQQMKRLIIYKYKVHSQFYTVPLQLVNNFSDSNEIVLTVFYVYDILLF